MVGSPYLYIYCCRTSSINSIYTLDPSYFIQYPCQKQTASLHLKTCCSTQKETASIFQPSHVFRCFNSLLKNQNRPFDTARCSTLPFASSREWNCQYPPGPKQLRHSLTECGKDCRHPKAVQSCLGGLLKSASLRWKRKHFPVVFQFSNLKSIHVYMYSLIWRLWTSTGFLRVITLFIYISK